MSNEFIKHVGVHQVLNAPVFSGYSVESLSLFYLLFISRFVFTRR